MDFTTLPSKTPQEKAEQSSLLHRKIELQSPVDLHYIQRNLARAARERLDLHFPLGSGTGTGTSTGTSTAPGKKRYKPATVISLDGARRDSQLDRDGQGEEGVERQQQNREEPRTEKEKGTEEGGEEEEDPLRKSVRLLVDEFLRATYESAAQSISVNGNDAALIPAASFPSCSDPDPRLDGSDTADGQGAVAEREGVDFTYAPFDAKLQRKLAGLHAELESLTAQVSRLRREVPGKAAAAYIARLEADVSREDADWAREEKRLEEERETYTGLELESSLLGKQTVEDWNREVKEMYDLGVARLGVLSGTVQDNREKSLTETIGKVQRARTVALELE